MLLMDLMKRLGWRAGLLPFVTCVCVYWAIAGADGDIDTGADAVTLTAAKCAPVLCLMVLVLVQRAQRSDPQARAYCGSIAAGLALSAAGDALLVRHALRGGMAAFGLAHVCYCRAFGVRPAALALGAAAVAVTAGYCSLLLVPPPLRLLVPAYALLLAAAAWRAGARGAGGGGSGRCSAAGGALFMLSDALLAWGLFNHRLPYQQVLVMSSYYLAQLCIALSAALLPKAPRRN